MTDTVFKLRAVDPPKDAPTLTDQLRILANAIEEGGDAPDTLLVITLGAKDGFTFLGHSTIGADPGPFAHIGVLEAVKKSILGG